MRKYEIRKVNLMICMIIKQLTTDIYNSYINQQIIRQTSDMKTVKLDNKKK